MLAGTGLDGPTINCCLTKRRYNPWGRPGAGAPLRDSDGNALGDIRGLAASRASGSVSARSSVRGVTPAVLNSPNPAEDEVMREAEWRRGARNQACPSDPPRNSVVGGVFCCEDSNSCDQIKLPLVWTQQLLHISKGCWGGVLKIIDGQVGLGGVLKIIDKDKLGRLDQEVYWRLLTRIKLWLVQWCVRSGKPDHLRYDYQLIFWNYFLQFNSILAQKHTFSFVVWLTQLDHYVCSQGLGQVSLKNPSPYTVQPVPGSPSFGNLQAGGFYQPSAPHSGARPFFGDRLQQYNRQDMEGVGSWQGEEEGFSRTYAMPASRGRDGGGSGAGDLRTELLDLIASHESLRRELQRQVLY